MAILDFTYELHLLQSLPTMCAFDISKVVGQLVVPDNTSTKSSESSGTIMIVNFPFLARFLFFVHESSGTSSSIE